MSRMHFWIAAVPVVGILVMGLMADGLLASIEKSLEIGRPVAQAVVDAHAEKGSYPETLAELVPNYLEALPEDAEVRLARVPDLKLIVKVRKDLTVGYDFIEQKWYSYRKQMRWLTEPPVLAGKSTG